MNGFYSYFKNWGMFELNGNISENCVFIDRNNFEWVDVGCNNSYRFICEKIGWCNVFKFLFFIIIFILDVDIDI